MPDKVLFVDDDPDILAAFRRHLRKQFQIETALSGKEGLESVEQRGPYAVVVSDLGMPGMDGIEFLSHVREVAPDSVRMMLTGHADLDAAIEAVNEGNIFRFLTKPCPGDILGKALSAGVEQYRLVTAERELLEKTLSGSIKVVTEVLALVSPEAFGRSSRIKRYVQRVASEMGIPDAWRLETAAMLSQIGCVILPQDALKRLYEGQNLAGEESELFQKHPSIAAGLLAHVPRMEEVAEIVAYQEKRFDGSGIPEDSRAGAHIPLGARILKLVLDFDMLEATGASRNEALAWVKGRSGWYDPEIVAAFEAVVGRVAKSEEIRGVNVQQLRPDMILAEDVRTTENILLVSRGQEVSAPLIERIRSFAQTAGIKEPILVQVPREGPVETVRPG